MTKQADGDDNKPWMIRDVPEHTRREVKIYAVQHGLTIAEALESLIGIAFKVVEGEDVAAQRAKLGLPPIDAPGQKELIEEEREKMSQSVQALFSNSLARKLLWEALEVAAVRLQPEIDERLARFNQLRAEEGLPPVTVIELMTMELQAAKAISEETIQKLDSDVTAYAEKKARREQKKEQQSE